MTKKRTTQASEPDIQPEKKSQFPLGRNNFIYMAIAGAAIVLGFILMMGEPSTADNFNPEIFSTRRIVVGPALAFLGFVGMAVAIIVKPKIKNEK